MFENSVDMLETLIHLREDGRAEPSARAARADPGLWTVAIFRAQDDAAVHADVWERHPTGDEVLCALSGAVEVHVRDRTDGPVATVTPGRSFVVPAGTWHRVSVREPGDLLTITPRTGTGHERMAAGG